MEKRRTRARVADAGPASDPFGEPGGSPAGAGLATVIHGTYAEALPVAEMSVGEVRRRFGDLLDIHPQANAVLDGVPVGDEARIEAGQNLMFVRRAGEKGSRGWSS